MRLEAKLEIEKYANYYESYSQEENALKYAYKLTDKIETYKRSLEENKNQPHLELIFLDEALQSVINCHRILKNTYIFGYYMKSNLDKAIQSLYQHHQEMLRVEADKLHELLEMQYLPNIIEISALEQFNKSFAEYKGKIITIMNATAKFKENILVEIENHPDFIDYGMLKEIGSGSFPNSKKKK